jgi:DNA primase
MSAIDEIKSRIDIVDLVSESGVKLRRSGKNYTGFCPFHPNTRTPAFVIFPESGTWRCFGQCNEGGDVFKFVMKKEGWDFPEALRRLAEKTGVQLEAFTPERMEQKEENERLRNLLEDAVNFYRHQLLNTPAGKPVIDYLLDKRKLTLQTIEIFGLGYAPGGGHVALEYFKTKGYTEQDLLDAGLVTERESGGVYDRFRNRLMIPIRNAEGRMTGFGARIIDPNDQPKFLNSPQTVLFEKSRLLYGLDRARKPIRAADQAVIVEGYLDVIALHQAGFENVVSPMGTALTEDQLRLLKRFTRRIVLALDPDAAGQKAVLRGLEAARASLDREDELRFDARGLLRHEARLRADLRVASMPDELDPDEIVGRDPEEWKKLIEAAQPIVTHVLETLAANRDMDDPKVKAEIAAQVLPLIEDLPNPIEREAYRQRLARRLRVDERALIGTQMTGAKPSRRGKRTSSAPIQKTESTVPSLASRPAREVEAYCLAVLLEHSDLLHRLDRDLQKAGLSALSIQDFEYTDHQEFFRLIQHSLEQDETETRHYVESHLPESLQGLYAELSAVRVDEPLIDKLLAELFRLIIRLRRVMVSESVNQLQFLQQDAQQSGDPIAAVYVDLATQYSLALQHLHLALAKRDDTIRK